jgi:hypothetical protein
MTMLHRWVMMFGLLAIAGCATAPGSSTPPVINADAQAVDTYHIGVDDQLQVYNKCPSRFHHELLNCTPKNSPDRTRFRS